MNIQLRWISLFSKSSAIRASVRLLSYELGVNDGKKNMETGILLIKMDIAHYTGKLGNFNSLREVNLI